MTFAAMHKEEKYWSSPLNMQLSCRCLADHLRDLDDDRRDHGQSDDRQQLLSVEHCHGEQRVQLRHEQDDGQQCRTGEECRDRVAVARQSDMLQRVFAAAVEAMEQTRKTEHGKRHGLCRRIVDAHAEHERDDRHDRDQDALHAQRTDC